MAASPQKVCLASPEERKAETKPKTDEAAVSESAARGDPETAPSLILPFQKEKDREQIKHAGLRVL